MPNLNAISMPKWARLNYSPEGWARAVEWGWFILEDGRWTTVIALLNRRDIFWGRRRLEVLKRANGHCEACDTVPQRLEVHHKTPIRFDMDRYLDLPINAPSELQALCVPCHGKTRRRAVAT